MRKVLLCILDGWGYSASLEHNAVAQAKTPNIDSLMNNYPNSLLATGESHVGLPMGQMGNSEVGHMTIGAGRVIKQELVKVDEAIGNGSIAQNSNLINLIAELKKSGGVCHLVGLLSDGAIHSHINHIIALASNVKAKGIEVKLHAITDGRDTPPKSATKYFDMIKAKGIEIATVSGRYYAMDRDNRWERTKLAYEAIALAKAAKFTDEYCYLKECYDDGVSDEFILPRAKAGYLGVSEEDGIIFCNYRADRMRQIVSSFADSGFREFLTPIRPSNQLTMTEYFSGTNLGLAALFQKEKIVNTLGEILSKRGVTQLRVSETEKYPHVTYFLNSGREEPFEGEDRILVPSPKVSSYDLYPEMSANEVTRQILENGDKYQFICANYANADMVGHSGDIKATIKACEAVDQCVGALLEKFEDWDIIITADHGNAEVMFNKDTGQPHTAHTLNRVPFIYKGQEISLSNGTLIDVAPTILDIMGIAKPKQMSGSSLLVSYKKARKVL